MHYTAINLAALSGKLAIESTTLNRYAKEGIKVGIDFAADMAKQAQLLQQSNFAATESILKSVQVIKAAARTYGLDSVVLFPCIVNGCWTACFSMGGGNIAGFCRELGIVQLEESNIYSTSAERDTLIKEYGVILFLRSEEE